MSVLADPSLLAKSDFKDSDPAGVLLPKVNPLSLDEFTSFYKSHIHMSSDENWSDSYYYSTDPKFHAILKMLLVGGFMTRRMAQQIFTYRQGVYLGSNTAEDYTKLRYADKRGLNILMLFMYLRIQGINLWQSGDTPVHVGRYAYNSLSGVLEAADIEWNREIGVPLELETVGDVRRVAAMVLLVATVQLNASSSLKQELLLSRAHPIYGSGSLWFNNRTLCVYVEENTEAAVPIAEFAVERRCVGGTYAEAKFVIDWYEGKEASVPLREGLL